MLPNWYTEYKNFVESSIKKFIDDYFEQNITNPWLERFKEILYYSTKWWKKIRAILALEFYLVFSWKKLKEIKNDDDIIKVIIAIELIHTYSLIHDDLPCMDNDEYRRGELTVWNKFTEYEAVLCWDLLNTLTFELLSQLKNENIAIKLINLFSRSVWFYWMIWWQIDDMFFEKNFSLLNIEHLEKLHNKKTWALIKASILSWIILSWKDVELKNYEEFWIKLWLAFQVRDDLLDVEWTFEETWKSVWWEQKWFVHFMWPEKSRQHLTNLLTDCKTHISSLNSEKLNFIIDYIWNRKK